MTKEMLKAIVSRKRTVLKDRHGKICFDKKDVPYNLLNFCHNRICSDMLGLSTVKASVHKLLRNYYTKLKL